MQIIDDVHAKGGKIVSFTSYCGGLPAPDSNNNPLGYKFSWSARGVLLASTNSAVFLQDGGHFFHFRGNLVVNHLHCSGEKKEIPGKDLFDSFHLDHIPELNTDMESYPNRNSLQYIDIYGIPSTKTMIRGTYRNKGGFLFPSKKWDLSSPKRWRVGWCPTIKKLGADLGFLDLTERNFEGVTYAQALREMIGSKVASSLIL